MSAFNARSASALLSPAPSAMLSTSSDLFTLASEMCACSKEVERIYDGTSSISTLARTHEVHVRRTVHVRDRRCVPLAYPLLDLAIVSTRTAHRARVRATRDEGTTAHVAKWWISHTHAFARRAQRDDRDACARVARACARATCAHTSVLATHACNRARPATTRRSAGRRVARSVAASARRSDLADARSPALRAGLRGAAPSRFELPLPP